MVQVCRLLWCFILQRAKLQKQLYCVSQQVNHYYLETVTMPHETCKLLCLWSQELSLLENVEVHRLLGLQDESYN